MTPTVSILVPFRSSDDHRQRLWAYCRAAWQRTPFEVIEASDDSAGPFTIARAFNEAAARASGDVFITFGADHLPDIERIEWAVEQLRSRPWTALFTATAEYSPADTEAILDGTPLTAFEPRETTPHCTAIVAVHRDQWISFDERFVGWGSEDTAWRIALESLRGTPPAPPAGALRSLWHPPSGREHATRNYALLMDYREHAAAGTLDRYLDEAGVRY